MALYAPKNQYLLPHPSLFGQAAPKFMGNFTLGALYGGIWSAIYCQPMPRVMKVALGWGAVFGLSFSHGLYNEPGYIKAAFPPKPDFQTTSGTDYGSKDWVDAKSIEAWPSLTGWDREAFLQKPK